MLFHYRLHSATALFALLFALATAQVGAAQSLWTKPYEPNQIGLELLQPALDTEPNEELSFLTGAGAVWGSYLLNDRTTLTAAVPFAHYRAEIGNDNPVSQSTSVLGNPYVGLGFSSTRVPFLVELGTRLPVVSERNAATFAGRATDLDHSEIFSPHLFSTQLLLNPRWELSRTASVRLRGGPLVTIPTQDNSDTTELFARYSAQSWVEGDRYIVGLGVTGRTLVTEGGGFDNRTTHQAGGTLIFNFPSVQPGVLLRVPINGPESDAVGLIVGVTLTASL